MKCIECQHIDLQASKAHSKVGIAPCKRQIKPPGNVIVFESLEHERDCAKFEAATADVVEKRIAWRAKQ